MLTLTRALLRWDAVLPVDRMEAIAERAFDVAERERGRLEIDETGVSTEVVEGTVHLAVEIGVCAVVLFQALSSYGSFWGGIDTIRRQARSVGDSIRERSRSEPALPASSLLVTRVTTGQLTSLERLHRRVQEGDLNAEEALRSAMSSLERAGEEMTPTLIGDLEGAFHLPHRAAQRLAEFRGPPSAGAYRAPAERMVAAAEVEVADRVPRHRPRGVRITREPGSTRRTTEVV